MIKVSCPRCKKVQNYQPQAGTISKKVKRCVYCGYTFKVHPNLKDTRIVEKR